MLNQTMKANSSKDDSEAWTCQCGQLLGRLLEDPLTDESVLNVKHKDLVIAFKGGPDSWVRRNCHKCGRQWVLSGKENNEKE